MMPGQSDVASDVWRGEAQLAVGAATRDQALTKSEIRDVTGRALPHVSRIVDGLVERCVLRSEPGEGAASRFRVVEEHVGSLDALLGRPARPGVIEPGQKAITVATAGADQSAVAAALRRGSLLASLAWASRLTGREAEWMFVFDAGTGTLQVDLFIGALERAGASCRPFLVEKPMAPPQVRDYLKSLRSAARAQRSGRSG